MALTPAQLTVFRAALLAELDPELVGYRTNGQTPLIAAWYNTEVSGFVVWRKRVTRAEAQAVGFDWTQVDNLNVGQARIWFDGLFMDGLLDATDEGQRAGVAEAWKGTAAKVAVATFVLSKCKRNATRAERLFAVGAGTDLSPATAPGGELSITDADVSAALAG